MLLPRSFPQPCGALCIVLLTALPPTVSQAQSRSAATVITSLEDACRDLQETCITAFRLSYAELVTRRDGRSQADVDRLAAGFAVAALRTVRHRPELAPELSSLVAEAALSVSPGRASAMRRVAEAVTEAAPAPIDLSKIVGSRN